MDTYSAFAMGQAHKNRPSMVFDWIKAAKLIIDNPSSEIEAGLAGDFEYTGGVIWRNGHPFKDNTYLASTWATPQIVIDGCSHDCFIYKKDKKEWGSGTYYPPEARELLIEHFGVDIFKNVELEDPLEDDD